ncbi:FMN-binding negative transcriptional regulator [Chitinophaga ginsengisoli]|uniref:PaiB family negative transcriptional regulator n=1 Tax=Chitinophaga ginsengisoli TaxID=363837 RepID=A0A2P8FMW8_9BACT|nr:FMN-binding negative transcriptional regulator [Chitinophaga ginsengisoli]PSL23033.1 PaiB family negative transcriptional regulator [Chitinophaga ginsengisoli]
MYVPQSFQFQDNKEMIDFMKRYSFATIITTGDNIPLATHLPFFINEDAGKLVLTAHFSAVNPQAKYIAANTSLVIFSEPHAYISPAHYDKRESVPTWDYISVHAYGKASILDDEASKVRVLEQMISFYEPAYLEQWQGLSEKYKTGMMRGIIAFELEVTDLQGQKKLSQNKTGAERERIVRQLEESDNGVERDLANYIKEL